MQNRARTPITIPAVAPGCFAAQLDFPVFDLEQVAGVRGARYAGLPETMLASLNWLMV
jgi:hypothetical protein